MVAYECFSGVGCQDLNNAKQSHLARVSQEKVPRRQFYPPEHYTKRATLLIWRERVEVLGLWR